MINKINNQNELTATIQSVMKDNYSEKQVQDFSCWVDTIIEKEQEVNY